MGDENIVLAANEAGAAYCFNACSSCILPLQVEFTVDMSVVPEVSAVGVHLAGSFQGWDPGATALTDNGDGTWSVTLEIAPGEHQFKFVNGNAWGGEENMNGQPCGAGGDRLASFDADNNTYTACFNACPGEVCLPDPDPANLTFQVDMNEQEIPEGASVFVFGGFTGWQGGAIALTDDNGDGIYETTQLVSGGVNVDYKYSIGDPNAQGSTDESGVYLTLEGDTTDFGAGGCGVGNGFGGFRPS